MRIKTVHLKNFRNFSDSIINFSSSCLIIGANDVGKTNLVHALRILLDKSLSERDIEPEETDFHIKDSGIQAEKYSITVFFSSVKEDAVLRILKGHVSDNAESIFKFVAYRNSLDFKLYVGSSTDELEEIHSRYYLKYLNLRYVNSQRDLHRFIRTEKKHLLAISKEDRSETQKKEDESHLAEISSSLDVVNGKVRELNYVRQSTEAINEELQKLSYTFSDYEVQLDSGAIQVQQFIDNLNLGASSQGGKMMLGGDGRNNQILLALWKAKSQREHDPEHEVVFYCVEEPEAHLHPHQQRKLANYLIKGLPGQTIITSHSPQITAEYSPDSIIHVLRKNGASDVAKQGCSECISEAWDGLGYRMSILPAEAFFAKSVFLVEGPSERLFYIELAKALEIDLDYHSITILSVDGVQFSVYVDILDAMEIPWTIRTDNDVSKIKKKQKEYRNLAGINRCLALINEKKYKHRAVDTTAQNLVDDGTWSEVSKLLKPHNIYLAKVDLEHDLSIELAKELCDFSGKVSIKDAVKYLQSNKAIRMREFLSEKKSNLPALKEGELVRPLLNAVKIAREES